MEELQCITPSTPTVDIDGVDLTELESTVADISNQLIEANIYLAYQFSFNILVITFAVFIIVYKFLHTTFFKRNDFLN